MDTPAIPIAARAENMAEETKERMLVTMSEEWTGNRLLRELSQSELGRVLHHRQEQTEAAVLHICTLLARHTRAKS